LKKTARLQKNEKPRQKLQVTRLQSAVMRSWHERLVQGGHEVQKSEAEKRLDEEMLDVSMNLEAQVRTRAGVLQAKP
jgi:hypothetical protein